MNKKDMVTKVAEGMGVTKKEAALAVDTVLDVVSDSLASGEKVSLAGFGVFETVKRNARTCRNLQDGSKIEIPAKMAPRFRPSKAMKESVAKLPVE
jgi:DNA-binding protein HU-beta